MNEVIELIRNLDIYDRDYVVLACSYGPDSMCLLDILRKLNMNVIVAHVNHNYRKESVTEYDDLEKYCNDNDLIFEGTSINEEIVGNREEFYRNFRYVFFSKVVKKYNAKYLFTAHHGDDLVETILMRLSRGSSFKGYGGFSKITKTKDYIVVRPLIYLTKDEIMDYVEKNNIPYALDYTNLENIYTRNKYRNEVLPILKKINPLIHKKIIKFSDTLNEYNDYIEKEVDNLYSSLYLNNRLDLNEFMILPNLLKKCLLKKILFNIYGDNISVITDKHLDLIFELIDSDKKNSFINLPKNIEVNKYYNILVFGNKKESSHYDLIFNDKILMDDWALFEVDTTDIIKSNYLIRLNSKDITLPLHVRNRLTGDKIILKNGTKKVGEILSEAKISMNDRDKLPIMVDNRGNILWIPGIKKSKFDKQINEEYDIIIKYVKKGDKEDEK